MKYIATADFTYQIIPVSPGVNPSGTITDMSIASLKVKAVGKGVIKDQYQVTISGITDSGLGATTPDPVTYTANFSATSNKVKADGEFVVLLNDETSVINAMPIIPGSPPTPTPTAFKIKIVDTGQTKVLAN